MAKKPNASTPNKDRGAKRKAARAAAIARLAEHNGQLITNINQNQARDLLIGILQIMGLVDQDGRVDV